MTKKEGKFIDVRFINVVEGVSYLKERFSCLLGLQDRFPSVKVFLLAIPPISVVEWNRAKRHTSPENFKEAESIVSRQLEINNWI